MPPPIPQTIAKLSAQAPAVDHRQLYGLGLQHVQQLSSRIWTDYNLHDPGITILELLCYALTDLGYRASFPVADLLAASGPAAGDTLFTARQILPNRPLTLLDYRKLLIDLPGVKNAWLAPAPQRYYADTRQGQLLAVDSGEPGVIPVDLKGLYAVTIEYNDNLTQENQDQVMDAVKVRLQANRNLCEDFVSFDKVDNQPFRLCAELEVTPAADVSRIAADIWFQVQQYLAPAVANYSLSDMLARTRADGTPYTVDEIFEGPLLDCGFIDDEELAQAELRQEIRLSDVINIIMDIEGVTAVRDIVIIPVPPDDDESPPPLDNKWVVPVAAGKKALLVPPVLTELPEFAGLSPSRLVFYKQFMPVIVSESRVRDLYDLAVEEARNKAETPVVYDFEVPEGRDRQLRQYYSVQNHLPEVYGISSVGLPPDVSAPRKALAYQLKGYLLFFDQLMANYCVQLSQVKALLSTDPDLQSTYFFQVVESFADYQKIYRDPDSTDALDAPQGAILALQQANDAREREQRYDRRNRFLDHLIARFAEQFYDLAYTLYLAFEESPENWFRPEALIRQKCDFLANYPEISRDRALAYNYTLQEDADLWNSDNVSGLAKRIARLLGIRNHQRRNLGDVTYDIYAEIDATPSDEFRFRLRHRQTQAILLSSSMNYATEDIARAAMRRALDYAQLPTSYQRRVATDGRHYFNLVDETGVVVARRIEYFATEAAMNQAIDEVIEYFKENYSDEGMYLIELILLRPEDPEVDPFLPICPLPDCTDCADADPYSYRLQVILPAYGSRFSNPDFRRFTEQVIRAEVPAHILPKVCWINADAMAELESRYRDWLYLKAGVTSADRQAKLNAFIESLFSVKNVYPAQSLNPCDSPEQQPKFIVGRTALGTLDSPTPDPPDPAPPAPPDPEPLDPIEPPNA
jgi:predicted nucleic acid-binding protein